MKTPKIREFNTTDWMLLAGAEKFVSWDWVTGSNKLEDPLICDDFEYTSCILVADKNGIQAILDCGCLCLENDCPEWDQSIAMKDLENLIKTVDSCDTDEEVIQILQEKYNFELIW